MHSTAKAMTERLELSSYQPGNAAELAGWVLSPEEARAWCGHKGDDLPTASIFQEWHNDADVVPYLLMSDTRPVAYGEIWIDHVEQEIELARLIVRPENRNRGIGSRLVEELIVVASGFRFDAAYLRVFPENTIAISCYRKAGFKRVSDSDEQQFNANQPVDYTWMSRRLNK